MPDGPQLNVSWQINEFIQFMDQGLPADETEFNGVLLGYLQAVEAIRSEHEVMQCHSDASVFTSQPSQANASILTALCRSGVRVC